MDSQNASGAKPKLPWRPSSFSFRAGSIGLAIQMDEGAEGTVDFDEFAVLTSTGSSSQRPPIDVSPLPTIAPTATQE